MTKLLLSIIACMCVFHSAAFAETNFWQKTSGPGGAFIFMTTPNGYIYAGVSDGSVYRSTDHGTIWTRRASSINATVHSVAVDTAGNIFCATENGLFRSVNGDTNWTIPNANLNGQPVFSVVTFGNTILIGTEFAGTYRSTDLGMNWAPCNGFPNDIVNVFGASHSIIYAGMYSSGIYRSMDNGITWSRTSTGLPYNASVNALSVAPNGAICAGIYTEIVNNSQDTQGVYQSIDNGMSWTKLSGEVDTIFNPILVNTNKDIFVASQYNVYHSTDNGMSWRSDTSGLMGATVYGFGVDSNGYIYAATANGIFRSTSSTPVIEPSIQPPFSPTLEQNYPNPFNANTSIQLAIPQTESVSLGVYDVLGNEVKHVFDGKLEEGVHQMMLDASGLPNGVYYYRIQAGGFTQTKSMLLLR